MLSSCLCLLVDLLFLNTVPPLQVCEGEIIRCYAVFTRVLGQSVTVKILCILFGVQGLVDEQL